MFDFLKRKVKDLSSSVEARVRVSTEVKKKIVGKTKLSEKEIDSFLEEFELSLVESDVATEVAESICKSMKEKLSSLEFSRGENIKQKVTQAFRETISEILDHNKSFEITQKIGKTPLVIMFLGPNGAGKTTTIAKIAKMLQDKGRKVVFAAADTFRAASIEQLEEHASRMGVRVIKHKYGADPAAVAFDAVSYANTHGIDVVLIDTAGRQETNINLLEQMKKIDRVVKPDLRIFVGEAVVGNAILDQIRAYKDTIGLDGVVLSKLDLDVKGGTILSVVNEGVPVIYYGIGQEYKDLMPFDKDFLLSKMFS